MLSVIPLRLPSLWESRLSGPRSAAAELRSPLWKKMIANILNIKVDVIESEEGPALGGAMLAAVANGEFASVEERGSQDRKSY